MLTDLWTYSPIVVFRPLGATLQLAHAFGDDLCGFHCGLAQLRILDYLALDPLTFALQKTTQAVELVDQPVDLLEGRARNPLKQRIDAARTNLGVALRLRMSRGCHVRADNLADLSFEFRRTHGLRLI